MTVPGLTPYAQAAVPLVQRTLAAASISTSYALVGSLFSKPVIMMIIVSTLDQAVQLSLDGTNNWCPIPAGATMIVDMRMNNICLEGWRGVYAKEIGDPTTGTLYVTGFTL
jgi:hypothetical protein